MWLWSQKPASSAIAHGITLFETDARGERVSTRYASGYFRVIRDFARDGKLHGTYDDAEVTTPSPRSRD